MKFATSISLGLTLAAVVSALPHQSIQEHCQKVQYTGLQCVNQRESGVMYRCAGGEVIDYSCPGGQVCVMFTFGSSTSAACADKPPTPVQEPTQSSSTSYHTKETASIVPTQSTTSALTKPSVHPPCECAPLESSSSVYMNDFLITYQNQGYFWDVAVRDANSDHRFVYDGVNAEGNNFSAVITIEPKQPIKGGLPVGARLYECFRKSEKISSLNSDALIAPKCSLFIDNHKVASIEFSM